MDGCKGEEVLADSQNLSTVLGCNGFVSDNFEVGFKRATGLATIGNMEAAERAAQTGG
jgi:hypothetical protein